MKAAQLLAEEIDEIYCILDILDQLHRQLKANKPVKIHDLKRVINYLRVFVQKCHNTKEEDILFPELRKQNKPECNTILKEMRSENQLGDLYIKALSNCLQDIQNGSESAKQDLPEIIEKYLTLEKTHIQKEQLHILPLCNQEIPADIQEQLCEKFHIKDDQTFGPNMHDKFHKAFHSVVEKMHQAYSHSN